jgi:hypothetical protein
LSVSWGHFFGAYIEADGVSGSVAEADVQDHVACVVSSCSASRFLTGRTDTCGTASMLPREKDGVVDSHLKVGILKLP